jgi:hypothetical protein
MKKVLIAGVVGLIMTSSAALADEYSSTVTTQTNPINPYVTTTTRVDKSATTEDGMLTQRTNIYRSTNVPVAVPAPAATSTTTIERTTTTSSQAE